MRLPTRRAFTLIELLVVLTIIMVLAGLLLPAIKGVLGQSRTSRCASNQRMIVIGTVNYLQDNDGYMPYDGDNEEWWPKKVTPFLDSTYQTGNMYKGNNVFHCPHAEIDIRNPWNWWSRFDNHFAMNDKLYSRWMAGWPGYAFNNPVNVAQIRPGMVMYSEAQSFPWGASIGLYNNVNTRTAPPWPLEGTAVTLPIDNTLTVRRIVLHRGTVNRAFADGHIAAVAGTWRTADEDPNWAR